MYEIQAVHGDQMFAVRFSQSGEMELRVAVPNWQSPAELLNVPARILLIFSVFLTAGAAEKRRRNMRCDRSGAGIEASAAALALRHAATRERLGAGGARTIKQPRRPFITSATFSRQHAPI